MRICLVTVFTAAALTFAAPSLVQAQNPTSTPAMQETVPLAADGVTPEKIELTHKLVIAMDIEKSMKARMDATMKMVGQATRSSMPNVEMKEVLEIQTKVMDKYMPRMMDAMIQAYPEVYTKQELTDMVAFYETPTGRSVVRKSPLIIERSGPQMTPIINEMQADMMSQIMDLVNKEWNESQPTADHKKVG